MKIYINWSEGRSTDNYFDKYQKSDQQIKSYMNKNLNQ